MHIVQVEDFFYPEAGDQINILSKYFVKLGHRVSIVCAEMEKMPDFLIEFYDIGELKKMDELYSERYGVEIYRIPLRGYSLNRYIFESNVFSIVDSLCPDILYVHGNDTYIGCRYLLKASKCGYPIVTDSHMLMMASTSKWHGMFAFLYKNTLAKIIIKHEIPVIRTQNDLYVEEELGIPLRLAPFIPLGSDMGIFHADLERRLEFRKENNIGLDSFLVVYAGKLDYSKGADILSEALIDKIESNKQIEFLIVGNTVGEFGNSIEKNFVNSENIIHRLPTQKYIDLAPIFQSCDLVVFPKQCSLSFYDVQACGVPVLSENNQINVERNSHGNAICFQSGNAIDLRKKIIQMSELNDDEYEEMSLKAYEYIKNNYDYGEIAKKYLCILEDTYNKWRVEK